MSMTTKVKHNVQKAKPRLAGGGRGSNLNGYLTPR